MVICNVDGVNDSKWWGFVSYRRDKGIDLRIITLSINNNACTCVDDTS